MAFNVAAVNALFAAAVSKAQALGVFDRVNQHEPKNAPGRGLSCSFWSGSIRPVKQSGLATTTGVFTLTARVYSSFIAKPEDGIDPALVDALSVLIAAYSEDFNLGGTVRDVDLLGQFGPGLSAQFGYIEQDGKHFRTAELEIPIVVDDMWSQSA